MSHKGTRFRRVLWGKHRKTIVLSLFYFSCCSHYLLSKRKKKIIQNSFLDIRLWSPRMICGQFLLIRCKVSIMNLKSLKKNALQTTDLFWIVWLQESENMSHVSCGQSHVCFDLLMDAVVLGIYLLSYHLYHWWQPKSLVHYYHFFTGTPSMNTHTSSILPMTAVTGLSQMASF